jgi:hypothetical protein
MMSFKKRAAVLQPKLLPSKIGNLVGGEAAQARSALPSVFRLVRTALFIDTLRAKLKTLAVN